jgi:hypothetical protein
MINSDTMDKKNIVQLYNLFFSTSINYSKNFHSYMEIYYGAILDLIKHKINDCSKMDLKYDYNSIIDNIINKSYTILSTKKEKRENASG